MTVLRYYPDLVARAVLSGMEGPDHTYDRPTGLLNAIKRYAQEAQRSPAIRQLFPHGIMAAIDSIRASLTAQPVTVEVPDPNSGERTEMTFGSGSVPGLIDGYSSNIRARSRVAGWPADIYRLYTGDFEHVARTRLADAPPAAPSRSYRTASFFMLDCGSGITEERLEEYRNDPAIPYVGDRSAFYRAACPPWDADLGDDFRDLARRPTRWRDPPLSRVSPDRGPDQSWGPTSTQQRPPIRPGSGMRCAHENREGGTHDEHSTDPDTTSDSAAGRMAGQRL